MNNNRGRIGLICDADHEVFGSVGEALERRGFDVVFFEPGREIPRRRLDALDLLVNKKIRWESLDALEYAHRNGIAAWNGYVATWLFVNRLSQLSTLAVAGFDVPAVRPTPPDGDYVSKEFFDVQNEPTLNGEGDFYQRRVGETTTDYKYYAVDDGEDVRASVVVCRSKLYGEREVVGRMEADPDVVERIRRLLAFTGARAVGVDVVETDGRTYAVDVNPATSFRRTGLGEALTDSIADAAPA
jgi:hypothetical protein